MEDDRILRYAAVFFLVGFAVHNADHIRRGASSVTTELFVAGTLAGVVSVVTIVLVLLRPPRAPQLAVAAGLPLAIGLAAGHVRPTRSVLSDSLIARTARPPRGAACAAACSPFPSASGPRSSSAELRAQSKPVSGGKWGHRRGPVRVARPPVPPGLCRLVALALVFGLGFRFRFLGLGPAHVGGDDADDDAQQDAEPPDQTAEV